jgi:hypothetical protein
MLGSRGSGDGQGVRDNTWGVEWISVVVSGSTRLVARSFIDKPNGSNSMEQALSTVN